MVEKTHPAGWFPSIYEPFRQAGRKIADWCAPPSEARAGEEKYEVTIELPGVKPEDIEVSTHDGQLMVKGEKRAQREEKGETYFFSEREYGSFQRSFRLPADAAQDGITADFDNGVLILRVPKTSAKVDEKKTIKVRAA